MTDTCKRPRCKSKGTAPVTSAIRIDRLPSVAGPMYVNVCDDCARAAEESGLETEFLPKEPA